MQTNTQNVALVTGGASGMGRLMAERLAGSGWKVAIVDVNQESLTKLAGGSNNLYAYPCDVTDVAAVAEMVANVERDVGPISRLAHAAAIMPGAPIEAMEPAVIRRVMDINYGGTVNVTKAVLPFMIARKRGEMVIFGSIAGVAFSQNLGAYCASKAAVNAYAEVMIHEHEGSGVAILLVCPSGVATPLIDQALQSGPASLRNAAKSGKLEDPGEIIDAIEAGLKGGKNIIFPGQAKLIWRMRRFSPNLTWRFTTKANTH